MTSHVAGLYSFRSVLPEICPFKMASIFWLTSPSETSSVKSSRHSSFHSLANLSQSFNLGGMGHCTESIPSKDTPRKINGNTLTLRSAEAVRTCYRTTILGCFYGLCKIFTAHGINCACILLF